MESSGESDPTRRQAEYSLPGGWNTTRAMYFGMLGTTCAILHRMDGMIALAFAALLSVTGVARNAGDALGSQSIYASSSGFLVARSMGPLIAYPDWLPDFAEERPAPSILPAWISGILDSPVFRTPMRFRISLSGFMLGWRLSFDL
jgi:hypothetical protein